VLGIGINVNQTRDELPTDARQPVASLRTIDGREHDRAALLIDLLARLDRFYGAWRAGGLDAVFHDLGSRDFLRGRRVSVDDTAGTAIGITRSGALEVELDGERRLIEAGEITYER
jgi:BirA family biotin operon repressor/biotin-[acetyl-CoA-carboxylase] ligase